MNDWGRLALAGILVSLALAIALGLGACGSGSSDAVIARVRTSTITQSALSHWMTTLAPEHAVPDPPHYTRCVAHQEAGSPQSIRSVLEEECKHQYEQLRQQALDFLISSEWLIGEAADRGLKLGVTASPADDRFKAEAELAAARIRATLTAGEPKVPEAQIADYYRRHISRFERRERRYIDIVERFPTQEEVRSLMREVAHGKPLSAFDPLHEEFDRPMSFAEVVPKKQIVMKAIFAAKAHVLVGPVPLNGYSVFEVTRISPRVVQPLAQVHGQIEQQLTGAQQQRALAQFIKAWRSKWIALTDCRPGYVVQKCRQYGGPMAPEEPLALD